ncbi:hypothetical protein [Marinicrinis sediminis]|uniref:Cytochrome C biogenesis protein transmembrane domain-containing protein n=1 Tax=Marinicrinis sediminis TaxID=1652465 RepID=A0ABW5RF20_9BACL
MHPQLKLHIRIRWALIAAAIGICIAGFWNYHVVDGIGKDWVAGSTIGDTGQLAGSFGDHGYGFGFLFAVIAGLAATFTACNCVVFAMMPGLACSSRTSIKKTAIRALLVFSAGVILVCAVYGGYISLLRTEQIVAMNERSVRLAQAQWVFSSIGLFMLIWAMIALGFLHSLVKRLPRGLVTFFSRPDTKAGVMGMLVGLFTIGRPFPVFRDFLTYAAEARQPLYGAAVMSLQGLAQIAVMILLMLVLIWIARKPLTRWLQNKPYQAELISALALTGGGAYFLFYWGLARWWDLGAWGFKLGWYAF